MDDKDRSARLGYKQEFKREFTTVELFGFGFSIIAVVPGVASVLVYSLPNGGPAAMIWGWAASSFFLMFIAMAMAELASSAPTSGGLYYWTYKYSSLRFRYLLSWLVGYMNTISYITGVAGVDYACAVQIMAAVSIATDLRFIPTVYETFDVYCAILVSHTLIASLGTEVVARLQHVFILINVALILVMLIGLPASTPTELRNSSKFAFGNFDNMTLWPDGYAFILSFLAPLWSIGGFDAGVHISEEAKNANVAVPLAIISATGLGCLLGFAIQISVAFCMGDDIVGILSSPVQQPMATFWNSGNAIWSFIIIAQFMAGASILISSSRQTFAFSRDGALQFSGILHRINPYTGTPVHCVCFSASIACVLGLLTFAGSAATGVIFSVSVVGQYVANSIPLFARYLGGQPFERGPFHLGIFSRPVASVAVLWMLFMTIALLFPTAPSPISSTMNHSIVVVGGVVCLSLTYYYFPKYGGIHWFSGPVTNIDIADQQIESDEVGKSEY